MASVLRKLTSVLCSRISQTVTAPKFPSGHPSSFSYPPHHAIPSIGAFRGLSSSFGQMVRASGISSPLRLASFASSQLFQMVKCLPVVVTQVRNYKVRVVLKKRCKSCYFVKRQNRLFVECKAKPRHKQMQQISKRKLWREDYSEGNIVKAIYWKLNERRYYKLGNNEFARYDWLKGKIGVTV